MLPQVPLDRLTVCLRQPPDVDIGRIAQDGVEPGPPVEENLVEFRLPTERVAACVAVCRSFEVGLNQRIAAPDLCRQNGPQLLRAPCVAVRRNIRQNLFFAFAYNAIDIPLAAGALYPFTGTLLSPVLAGAAMSFSDVSVVGNALRLRRARL